MKNLKSYLALSILAMGSLQSCTSEATDSTPKNATENPVTPEIPKYAMTAKINGVLYQMNSTDGTNKAISPYAAAYPDEEYIRLQGIPGGYIGAKEISIILKRTDMVVGKTCIINFDTDGVTTHADYIDNTNDGVEWQMENTASGSITITAVDTVNKIVKGTFNFDASPNKIWPDDVDKSYTVSYEITEGTFNYRYDTK